MIAKTSISFEQSLISEWFCCVNAKGNRKCVPGRGQAFLLVLMLSFISSFQNWSSVMGALVHGRANFQPRGVSSINGGGRESAENKRRWLRERGCEHVDRSAERRFGVGGDSPGWQHPRRGLEDDCGSATSGFGRGRKEATILGQEEMPGLWGVSKSIGIKELRI